MKDKRNIVLIGMPSCGKSTVGVVLAKTINKKFVDTDLLIQERMGETLQETINAKGNDYFLQVEEDTLVSYEGEDAVVSTGGSAVYSDKAMQHLKEKGLVIYLKVSLEEVLNRLNNLGDRGVTMEPGQTLEDLYHYRQPFYEKYADLTVSAEGTSVSGVVRRILDEIEK